MSFDDDLLRAAMKSYLAACDALDDASEVGDEARQLLELAEAKAVTGLAVRKRLLDLGWHAPSSQRSST